LERIYLPQFVQEELYEKKKDCNLLRGNETDVSREMIAGSPAPLSAPPEVQPTPVVDTGKKTRIIGALHLSVLQQFVGVNAVTIYPVDILVRVVPNLAKVIPVILNLEGVIAGLISTLVLVKFGRKTILQFGTVWSVITTILVGVGYVVMNS
jgi:hypothetical protein